MKNFLDSNWAIVIGWLASGFVAIICALKFIKEQDERVEERFQYKLDEKVNTAQCHGAHQAVEKRIDDLKSHIDTRFNDLIGRLK